MRKKNLFSKTVKIDEPYAVFAAPDGWLWRVVKTYKLPQNEKSDQYARWFTFVTSPYCPEGEYGDTYCADVREYGKLVEATPEWQEQYGETPVTGREAWELLA